MKSACKQHQRHECVLMRSGKYGKVLNSSQDFTVSLECQAEDRPRPAASGELPSVCCFKAGIEVESSSMSQHDRKGNPVDMFGDKARQIRENVVFKRMCHNPTKTRILAEGRKGIKDNIIYLNF